MNPKILKLLPAFLFLVPLCLVWLETGCDKNEPDPQEEICEYMLTETDPAKLIIGKWELSKVWMSQDVGYRPVVKNDPGDIEYREFGIDSLAKIQNIKDGDLYTTDRKYWIDSLLHYNIDGGFPLTPWYYEFPDNCTLKLDNAFLAFSPISLIYKRIEQ
jgi:hypothetical protein